MRGRKSKLTPELHARLATILKTGLGIRATAQAVNISVPTLSRWLARGRKDPNSPHAHLADLFANDDFIAIKREMRRGFPTKVYITQYRRSM